MLATFAALSCQSEATDSGGSVCPGCEPQLGGETGDFGGLETFCGGVSRYVVIDRVEARALGFDVDEIERRIARPIDAPLRWVTRTDDAGGPASGYMRDTRVRAELVATGYRYWRADAEFCDGTVCTLYGESYPQAMCEPDRFVELAVRIDFETADHAVRGTAVGIARQWVPDPTGTRDPGLPLQVAASADLSEVTGSLRLHPDAGHAHYRGQLDFSAELWADGYSGMLFPIARYDTRTRTVASVPVAAEFPADRGTGGRAEVDAGRAVAEEEMPRR